MNRRGLNGSQLKLIAVITMLFDHIGYLLVGAGILPRLSTDSRAYASWLLVYALLRCIGRVAFPIFCFLLTEGFLHTSNKNRYALRLGLFAVLSEIPFDLVCRGRIVDWSVQNVFVTLYLGLLMLMLLEAAERNMTGQRGRAAEVVIIGAAALLAWCVRCDYDFSGILLIALLYRLRYDRRQACLLGFFWTGLTGGMLYLLPGFAASFWLISRYNGERGVLLGKRADKYCFYLFYPVHLALLYAVYRLFFCL